MVSDIGLCGYRPTRIGNVIVTVVPASGCVTNRNVPLNCSIVDRVTNKPRPVPLAAAGPSVIAVWDESSAAGTRIRARVVTTSGRDDKSPRLSPVVAVSDPGTVTYPAVAATTHGYVVFWTENAESGAGIRARRFSLR